MNWLTDGWEGHLELEQGILNRVQGDQPQAQAFWDWPQHLQAMNVLFRRHLRGAQ
jgi:hypothetical protein